MGLGGLEPTRPLLGHGSRDAAEVAHDALVLRGHAASSFRGCLRRCDDTRDLAVRLGGVRHDPCPNVAGVIADVCDTIRDISEARHGLAVGTGVVRPKRAEFAQIAGACPRAATDGCAQRVVKRGSVDETSRAVELNAALDDRDEILREALVAQSRLRKALEDVAANTSMSALWNG